MKKIWNSKTELFFTIEPSFFYRFHIILTITSVFQTIIFSIFSKNWFIVRRKDREHNAKIFLWEINTMQNNLWWKQQKRWQSQIGYNIINYELNRQMLAEEVILWEFMMDLCKSKTQTQNTSIPQEIIISKMQVDVIYVPQKCLAMVNKASSI